jgi:diaminohydroxyphosphoribosylaminopyrimidine deaminase/5-amino-6-(5-phosphoribosylamino)uracil reductase
MSFSAQDHAAMAEALRLAERGLNTTAPNPRVGCVIVRDGDVVGRGWHVRAGEPHAEVFALHEAGEMARGATAYVTLEPCAHTGRTPPCADALITSGVARVVIAVADSNPLVAGQGVQRLRAAGIVVDVGLMEAPARALNAGFLRRISGGLPWLRMKTASSLDGRTAMASGESQWITGDAARADVQCWRARSSAIITGIASVLADDSRLSVRLPDTECQPLRVVLDSQLRLSPQAKMLKEPGATLVLTRADSLSTGGQRLQLLQRAGAEVKAVATNSQGRLCPRAVMRELAQRQCNDVLLEAGATLNAAFLQAGLVDEWLLYQAPTLLGASARPLVDWPLTQMAQQQRWQLQDCRQIGDDMRMTLIPIATATGHLVKLGG